MEAAIAGNTLVIDKILMELVTICIIIKWKYAV